MLSLIVVQGFFRTKFGRMVAVSVVGAVSIIVAFLAFVSHERSVGARNATVKIDKANTKAVAIGSGSARKSADSSVRGQVDPTTRYDGAAR